jgi:hypothetical protein
MKKNQMLILGATGILAISTLTCATAFAVRPDWAGNGNHSNNNGGNNDTTQAQVTVVSSDAESLQFMVEEEKLAHDVYIVLYDTWGTSVFSSIANSETKHESRVANLLSTYSIQNPAVDVLGVFTNQELQILYNTLIEKGMQSEKDALEVGVIIEKEDIKDLQAAIDTTTNTRIKNVYSNLLKASYKHLEHFESLL